MSAVRVAAPVSFLRKRHERVLRCRVADAVLVRILGLLQLAEREIAAVEEAQRAVDRVRRAAEDARHLLAALSDAAPHWLRAAGRPCRS